MNRVIKFRAWDGERMWDESLEICPADDAYGMTLGQATNPDNYGMKVLMQFTGLLDKNGKEIWEGDIIESFVLLSENGENLRTVVKWGENGWLANGALSNNPQWMNNHQPEVIGNIYENPELIDKSL